MAMKCFEVVKQVLDATYADIPGDDADRDTAIRTALASMTKDYKDLTTTGGPDFSDPVIRFAYVFKYVTSHSHWIYETIGMSKDAMMLFRKEKLRMVAIGGGPGSDLVGVLKYMDTKSDSPALHCELIDGCQDWKTTWSDLAYELDWPKPLHTDYVTHDVAESGTWNSPSKIHKADLVTLSFFVSEIFHMGAIAEGYLRTMFARLKPGAIVLFSDNNASQFYGVFDSLAAKVGLEVLESGEGPRRIYDRGEEKNAIGDYAKKFNHQARLKGDLSWRVLRKPVAS